MMCDLFATRIQKVARLLGLDYYLRLDADSSITCKAKVKSPFETMRAKNAVYAYAHTLVESGYFTGPLTTAAFDYAQTLSTEGTIFDSIKWASSHQVYWFRSPMFYNNIELVKV